MTSEFFVGPAGVPPAPFQGWLNYCTTEGQNCTIDSKTFYKHTGACYATHCSATRDFCQQVGFDPKIGDVFKSHFQVAGDDALRLVHLEGKEAAAGFGIVASRLIRRGEVIARYNGEMRADYEHGREYQLQSVDAKEFRNLAGMINHSFPNALFLYHQHEYLQESVVVAMCDIMPDEKVCVDYGKGYENVRLGRHIEMRYCAAKAFVNRPHNWIEGCGSKEDEAKWRYLATNPSLVLELYLKGDWEAKELEQFLRSIPFFITDLPKNFETIRSWLLDGIDYLEGRPDLGQELCSYLCHACETRSCLGAVYAFKMLRELNPQNATVKQQLDPFIDGWELIFKSRLKGYSDASLDSALQKISKDIKRLQMSF